MTHEITVPPGAPTLLCLYADARWDEELTGPTSLIDLADTSDCIPMHTWYFAEPKDRWVETFMPSTQRWPLVGPGRGVLVDTPSHKLWDIGCRHRLTFTDAAGQRWKAEVLDLALNASRLSQDPEAVWVPIVPEPA